MTIEVYIPPTPLARGIYNTLIAYTQALAGTDNIVRLDVDQGIPPLLIASIDGISRTDFKIALDDALGTLEPTPESSRLPLLPGKYHDGGNLRNILGSEVALRKGQGKKIYDGVREVILKTSANDLIAELSRASISGSLEICLGSDCRFRVPRIVQSDAFYEIGRFGGFSDRRRGQPREGRIEYRASKPIASLLYAGLLGTHVGGEELVNEVHIFCTLEFELGKSVMRQEAIQAVELHKELLRRARALGVKVWAQDYEGLRYATILDIISLVERRGAVLPEALNIAYYAFAKTGQRFYSVISLRVPAKEVELYRLSLRSLASNLGLTTAKLASLLANLVRAMLRLLAYGGQAQHVYDAWVAVKILVNAALTGQKHIMLDKVYELVRLLRVRSREFNFSKELVTEMNRLEDLLETDAPTGEEALRKVYELVSQFVKVRTATRCL